MNRTVKDRVLGLRDQLKPWVPALSFGGGFMFDVLTVGRIDDGRNLAIAGAYLLLSGSILGWQILSPEDAGGEGVWSQIRHYRTEAIHFSLGALLNLFMIFYFKSASVGNAFVLLIFVASLLLLNEMKRFRNKGPLFKILLWQVSFASLAFCLVPIMVGHTDTVVFAGSLTVVTLVGLGLSMVLAKLRGRGLGLRVAMVVAVVALGFSSLYAARLIPPLPLSLVYSGVYHKVEHIGTQYKLMRQTPFWKFWQRGDQHFKAREGDKVWVYTQIFAPGGFDQKVFLHFEVRNSKGQWRTSDRIPLQVKGGRGKGYRGYAWKKNYQPGEWRVLVETDEQLEIGELRFEVVKDDSQEKREWYYELR